MAYMIPIIAMTICSLEETHDPTTKITICIFIREGTVDQLCHQMGHICECTYALASVVKGLFPYIMTIRLFLHTQSSEPHCEQVPNSNKSKILLTIVYWFVTDIHFNIYDGCVSFANFCIITMCYINGIHSKAYNISFVLSYSFLELDEHVTFFFFALTQTVALHVVFQC
ncbi:hypothetical protein BDA99DRAFT_537136 [Phascolomyces articulosus]|uniref:Uncharacterized protein n=1 Tax=Phascolomyces articulosus TaxID=60185 RepID=A0AAD5KAE4_9FUNG|nr:hypothetical protein BDA99DRAFT_537136 [Phascolomyces articulosus]